MKIIDNDLFKRLCAPWSPAEDDPRAGDYVRWMLRAEAGARFEG
jgi:hypothetical protein